MNLLIVDDSKVMRSIIKNSLLSYFKKPDYAKVNIYEAEDGVIAMESIAKEDIDIIFLDWNMPNMNGEEVIEAVRENPEWNDIQIIMATTEGSKTNVLRAIKKGADGYVVKPFSQDIIHNALNATVSRMLKKKI